MFKNKDVEYHLEYPPTGVDYNSWDKKTATAYFVWYLEQIPIRIDYLVNRISCDLNISTELLNLSPESLKIVWKWYIKTAIIEKIPRNNLKKIYEDEFYKLIGTNNFIDKQFSLNSLLIQRDIGMYLAQVFLNECPSLSWTFKHDPPKKKIKSVFNNQPVLTGFVGQDPPLYFEPIYMTELPALHLLKDEGYDNELFDLYLLYSKWLYE